MRVTSQTSSSARQTGKALLVLGPVGKCPAPSRHPACSARSPVRNGAPETAPSERALALASEVHSGGLLVLDRLMRQVTSPGCPCCIPKVCTWPNRSARVIR